MKHNITVEGFGYRLRPVEIEDAEFIIAVRLEDAKRNRYIHTISEDVNIQKEWIENYLKRENDYYFVIENKITDKPEGLISIYEINGDKAEWGRWVIEKGSFAAVESEDLMFKGAFYHLGLSEVYSRTIVDNIPVVKFHDNNNEKIRCIHKGLFELNGQKYDGIEHYVTKEDYENNKKAILEKKSQRIYLRNLEEAVGSFKFHHTGIACKNITREEEAYKLLGYISNGKPFEDKEQGIKGLFMVNNNMPEIELLENLPESKTLDYWLEHRVKMYHTGYLVKNIEAAVDIFTRNGAKIISPLKQSKYFEKRICFLILKNMAMVELIEEV